MNVIRKTMIRGFGGVIYGYIEEGSNGDKYAKSFGGKLLGYYEKSTNTTRTSGGTIVAFGDIVAGFLLPAKYRG